ncbi:hypothetical protein ACQJBY_052482 [Aegilops geniculata]
MANQEGKPVPTQAMAGQEGEAVDAPKSPAPAGSDTGLKLPSAADQDPDATVHQVGSGDEEEQEALVRGKQKKKKMDDPSGSAASGSTKKHRAADLPRAFQVAATVQESAASSGLNSTPFPAYAFLSREPFAAAAGVRPPPRRPPGGATAPAGTAMFFGPMTEAQACAQDGLSEVMHDKEFVLRAAMAVNWRPPKPPVLPPNDASRLKKCIRCNTNPATAVSLPSEHVCLCHTCYEECLADPLTTPCKPCFAAVAAQVNLD